MSVQWRRKRCVSVMEEKEMCLCDGGERCVSVQWRRKRWVSVMEEKEMHQCDGGERDV